MRLTAVHQLVEYEKGKSFSWFPEEVANARREADKDPLKKYLGKVANLVCLKSTKLMCEEKVIDNVFRSPFFDIVEDIGGAYEIKEFKQNAMIKQPYQNGIAVYQLAKLKMLEFYYDFLDRYFNRQDFEVFYMDTDLFYLGMSGNSLDEIVKHESRQAYEADKKNWLATDKFCERTTV